MEDDNQILSRILSYITIITMLRLHDSRDQSMYDSIQIDTISISTQDERRVRWRSGRLFRREGFDPPRGGHYVICGIQSHSLPG